ncbi:MAG: RtcB family protein [Candidatus Nanoarchaeia archaeon]|nr:RtcB family protein [Candidatus Nanoarchaeia archaeon]
MIVLKDNFIIMSDDREENAIEHLKLLMDHPAFKNERVRIMPDYHEGIGAVIGFTSTYSDLIIPNVTGVDGSCGILTYNIGKIENLDFNNFDIYARKYIPLGMNHHTTLDIFKQYSDICNLHYFIYPEVIKNQMRDIICNILGMGVGDANEFVNTKFDIGDIRLQLGTLGSGNHFIEIDKDNDNNIWITIHSGSRNFGLKNATMFQSLACLFKEKFHLDNITNDLAYLPMDFGGREYLNAMDFVQRFAHANRMIILLELLKYFKIEFNNSMCIESVHNYIDTKHRIIRKGAIELRKDQRVLVPLNMRDGVIIGIGKDNEKLLNWNFSAPHGAGRSMGRGEAKKKLSITDFQNTMTGIWSSSINSNTLDESPMAYKESNKIIEYLKEIMDIETIMKPVYSLKAEG